MQYVKAIASVAMPEFISIFRSWSNIFLFRPFVVGRILGPVFSKSTIIARLIGEVGKRIRSSLRYITPLWMAFIVIIHGVALKMLCGVRVLMYSCIASIVWIF